MKASVLGRASSRRPVQKPPHSLRPPPRACQNRSLARGPELPPHPLETVGDVAASKGMTRAWNAKATATATATPIASESENANENGGAGHAEMSGQRRIMSADQQDVPEVARNHRQAIEQRLGDQRRKEIGVGRKACHAIALCRVAGGRKEGRGGRHARACAAPRDASQVSA